jgi:co-chaperonin GroES (HSP10)
MIHAGAEIVAKPEILPAGTKMRMMGDRILVKPLPVEHSAVIEVVESVRPMRGIVVAVGPGMNPYKHKPHAYDRNKKTVVVSNHFVPTQVKVGDLVELGGANVFDGKGYQFPQVLIGTELHVICTERDVAGIVE